MNSSVERRQYFRINDAVSLFYQEKTTGSKSLLDEAKQSRSLYRFSLVSTLHQLETDMFANLQAIKEKNQALAEYLNTLNKKVHLIGKLLVASDQAIPESPTHDVNISAGGMAFGTDEQLADGKDIEMKFILYPYYLGIITEAKVISCKKDEEKRFGHKYVAAVEFTSISETDREALIRIILSKQSHQIRQDRQSTADGPEPMSSIL